jgi:hypothetical protein
MLITISLYYFLSMIFNTTINKVYEIIETDNNTKKKLNLFRIEN